MADIEALLAALSLEEKAALTAGEDFMSTAAVGRLGIPKIAVTDGPSGARGPSFPGGGGPPSACIPCGSAVGATWNPDLAERLGVLLGREALDRGCRGLLAPTVNLHRALLAGRNFECYSEDPLLSGRLAAGFVRGVQSVGVFATLKHLVGNEAEFERGSISSVIDERSLRELYLLPFEMAVREGGALGIMTSYNRLNGRWLTEQPRILLDILRREWGFQGLVMTDWFAVVDTVVSASAGLDLEMPGPARAFGPALAVAVKNGSVSEADLDAAVRRLLRVFDRIGALDASVPATNPAAPGPEEVALMRRAAAESMVLLRNDGTLPLDVGSIARVAVLGPNADAARIMGGGSSQVTPHRLESPLEALRAALGDDVEVAHERGCEIDRSPLPLGSPGLPAPDGFGVEYHAGVELAGKPIAHGRLDTLRVLTFEAPRTGVARGDWSMRIRGRVVPGESGVFQFALAQSGRARVFVDGALLLDGFTSPPPTGGSEFFGFASQDLVAQVPLEAGHPVEVVVEYAAVDRLLAGVRVGFRRPVSGDLLERAVAAAAAADVAVVVVGTSQEYETETRDRESYQLPGRQDELVRRVTAENPRTVVVVNAGAPVDMPWADDVAAVLQCWFGGQEMAAALADVLTGAAEPGGRLATTIPIRIEHSPSYDNFPGENGEVRYGEGLFMGYRGYEHRSIRPRFPFGHGLGYTTFELGPPTLSAAVFRPGDSLRVSVPVTNAGERPGAEVVQCYVAPDAPRLARPPKELKAFAKVWLEPGESTIVDLVLDDRSFAYWDPGQADWELVKARIRRMVGVDPQPPRERRAPGWQVDPGRYELLIGRSSVEIARRVPIEVLPRERE